MGACIVASVIFVFQASKQIWKQQKIRRIVEFIASDRKRIKRDVHIIAWDNGCMEFAVDDIREQTKERVPGQQWANWVHIALYNS